MSRVYDAMQRAEERRADPARLQGEASGSGRASLEERLDSLQNALCALEDRLDDETRWAQKEPALAGRGKPRDWDGRVAQLEVTVHALEEQFEASIHSTAEVLAHVAAIPRPVRGAPDRWVERLALSVGRLRVRLNRLPRRWNALLYAAKATLHGLGPARRAAGKKPTSR
jgi:hypothetical protein